MKKGKVQRRKKKLDALFENIVKNVAIDYSNREIGDIQKAVFEMLNRAKKNLNERGFFKISNIQPCGSMAEKVSLWKTHPESWSPNETEEIKYLEFDFLAVLNTESNFLRYNACCKGCMKVQGSLPDEQCLRNSEHVKRYGVWLEEKCCANFPDTVDNFFKTELSYSVASSCSCFSVKDGEQEYKKSFPSLPSHYSFESTSPDLPLGCDKCTVNLETGYLQIASSSETNPNPENSSLRLIWTSTAMTLFPHDKKTLQKCHPIKRLIIYIDFLPAIEIFKYNSDRQNIHECYLVPKDCCRLSCSNSWRISSCMEEISTVINKMSAKHKNCYRVLKYLLEVKGGIKTYHLKTAVLNHTMACSDVSKSYIKCIRAILSALQVAYQSGVLTAFCRKVNLLAGVGEEGREYYGDQIHHLLTAMSRFKSWERLIRNLSGCMYA